MASKQKRTLSQLACLALALTTTAAIYADEPKKEQPGAKWTDEQIRAAVAPMRAGKRLTPKTWPNGAKVAVCLSWDLDNDSWLLAAGNTEPVVLSANEYGAREGIRRILKLYDRYDIPASFFVPAVSGMLYPEVIAEIKKRPRHEIGVHGWIHEHLPNLSDRAEEARLLKKSQDFWIKTLGKKPVGFRAPDWAFSAYTLDLIREAGFEYDSSAMAMDEPYEINSQGKPTGLVELPVSFGLDDVAMEPPNWEPPELAFKVFQHEFDEAYQEGTYFMLTMHPMITGHRSHLIYLDRLIAYMKTKPGVWFATAQQITEYVKQQPPRDTAR
jgi:peptidoglycan-N-acetylglucosamine deacetylase